MHVHLIIDIEPWDVLVAIALSVIKWKLELDDPGFHEVGGIAGRQAEPYTEVRAIHSIVPA